MLENGARRAAGAIGAPHAPGARDAPRPQNTLGPWCDATYRTVETPDAIGFAGTVGQFRAWLGTFTPSRLNGGRGSDSLLLRAMLRR